jgi:hypothetical protein
VDGDQFDHQLQTSERASSSIIKMICRTCIQKEKKNNQNSGQGWGAGSKQYRGIWVDVVGGTQNQKERRWQGYRERQTVV